jgi:hypothetical protein
LKAVNRILYGKNSNEKTPGATTSTLVNKIFHAALPVACQWDVNRCHQVMTCQWNVSRCTTDRELLFYFRESDYLCLIHTTEMKIQTAGRVRVRRL